MNEKQIAKREKKPSNIDILSWLENREYFSFKEFHIDFSKEFEIGYKALNKRFNRLIQAGYIDKNNYNLSKEFELSEAGKRFLLNNRGLGKELLCRTHDLLFKAKIIKRPEWAFKNGFQVNDKVKNWKYPQYYTKLKNNILIQTSDEYVTIRIKEVNTYDSDVAIMSAFEKVVEILVNLVQKFKPLRLGYPERVVDIVRQHHAIKNKFVSQLVQEFRIKYKDDRIEVDYSKGTPEIEFIHPAHSQGDFRRVTDFLRTIAEGKFDVEKLVADYRTQSNNLLKKSQ